MGMVSEWKEPCANWYVVECSHKRRKLLSQPPSEPEERNHIDCLVDELLVEVLCRLPCSKSVILCKSVCKRWAALISLSFFITRFIASKVEVDIPCEQNAVSSSNRSIMLVEENPVSTGAGSLHETNFFRFVGVKVKMKEQPFAFVARMEKSRRSRDTWKGLVMHLRNPVSSLNRFSFSSLPSFEDGNATSFTLWGACNDLLLYCRDMFDKVTYEFYLSNVQTRKWLMLPTPYFYYNKGMCVGFICDPYYYFDGGNQNKSNVTLNGSYRYSVVFVPYTPKAASKLRAHLFSSTAASQWSDITLLLPKHIRLSKESWFCFGGKLLFPCWEGICGFDPFHNDADGVIQCHLIDWPAGFMLGWFRMGVCQERLLISTSNDDNILAIWLLEDYETGEWSLRHKVGMQDWISRDVSLNRYLNNRSFLVEVIGFHPIDADIIYCLGHHRIILYNLSTREAKLASHMPKGFAELYPCFLAFQLLLPIWPTPLPVQLVDYTTGCIYNR